MKIRVKHNNKVTSFKLGVREFRTGEILEAEKDGFGGYWAFVSGWSKDPDAIDRVYFSEAVAEIHR